MGKETWNGTSSDEEQRFNGELKQLKVITSKNNVKEATGRARTDHLNW